MAKKKSALTKRGAPTKECPQCHKSQHARKAVCAFCGYEFPRKSAKARAGRGKARNGAAGRRGRPARKSDQLAMEFVLFSQQGDIGKALDAVRSYEYSSLAQFIDAAGGKEQAVAALTTLQQRANN